METICPITLDAPISSLEGRVSGGPLPLACPRKKAIHQKQKTRIDILSHATLAVGSMLPSIYVITPRFTSDSTFTTSSDVADLEHCGVSQRRSQVLTRARITRHPMSYTGPRWTSKVLSSTAPSTSSLPTALYNRLQPSPSSIENKSQNELSHPETLMHTLPMSTGTLATQSPVPSPFRLNEPIRPTRPLTSTNASIFTYCQNNYGTIRDIILNNDRLTEPIRPTRPLTSTNASIFNYCQNNYGTISNIIVNNDTAVTVGQEITAYNDNDGLLINFNPVDVPLSDTVTNGPPGALVDLPVLETSTPSYTPVVEPVKKPHENIMSLATNIFADDSDANETSQRFGVSKGLYLYDESVSTYGSSGNSLSSSGKQSPCSTTSDSGFSSPLSHGSSKASLDNQLMFQATVADGLGGSRTIASSNPRKRKRTNETGSSLDTSLNERPLMRPKRRRKKVTVSYRNRMKGRRLPKSDRPSWTELYRKVKARGHLAGNSIKQSSQKPEVTATQNGHNDNRRRRLSKFFNSLFRRKNKHTKVCPSAETDAVQMKQNTDSSRSGANGPSTQTVSVGTQAADIPVTSVKTAGVQMEQNTDFSRSGVKGRSGQTVSMGTQTTDISATTVKNQPGMKKSTQNVATCTEMPSGQDDLRSAARKSEVSTRSVETNTMPGMWIPIEMDEINAKKGVRPESLTTLNGASDSTNPRGATGASHLQNRGASAAYEAVSSPAVVRCDLAQTADSVPYLNEHTVRSGNPQGLKSFFSKVKNVLVTNKPSAVSSTPQGSLAAFELDNTPTLSASTENPEVIKGTSAKGDVKNSGLDMKEASALFIHNESLAETVPSPSRSRPKGKGAAELQENECAAVKSSPSLSFKIPRRSKIRSKRHSSKKEAKAKPTKFAKSYTPEKRTVSKDRKTTTDLPQATGDGSALSLLSNSRLQDVTENTPKKISKFAARPLRNRRRLHTAVTINNPSVTETRRKPATFPIYSRKNARRTLVHIPRGSATRKPVSAVSKDVRHTVQPDKASHITSGSNGGSTVRVSPDESRITSTATITLKPPVTHSLKSEQLLLGSSPDTFPGFAQNTATGVSGATPQHSVSGVSSAKKTHQRPALNTAVQGNAMEIDKAGPLHSARSSSVAEAETPYLPKQLSNSVSSQTNNSSTARNIAPLIEGVAMANGVSVKPSTKFGDAGSSTSMVPAEDPLETVSPVSVPTTQTTPGATRLPVPVATVSTMATELGSGNAGATASGLRPGTTVTAPFKCTGALDRLHGASTITVHPLVQQLLDRDRLLRGGGPRDTIFRDARRRAPKAASNVGALVPYTKPVRVAAASGSAFDISTPVKVGAKTVKRKTPVRKMYTKVCLLPASKSELDKTPPLWIPIPKNGHTDDVIFKCLPSVLKPMFHNHRLYLAAPADLETKNPVAAVNRNTFLNKLVCDSQFLTVVQFSKREGNGSDVLTVPVVTNDGMHKKYNQLMQLSFPRSVVDETNRLDQSVVKSLSTEPSGIYVFYDTQMITPDQMEQWKQTPPETLRPEKITIALKYGNEIYKVLNTETHRLTSSASA